MNYKKIASIIIVVYLVLGTLFYAVAGDGLRYAYESTEMVKPSYVTGEIMETDVLYQKFYVPHQVLESLSLLGVRHNQSSESEIRVEIQDSQGTILSEGKLKLASYADDSTWEIGLEPALDDVKGKMLTAAIFADYDDSGMPISLYYGDSYIASKFEVDANLGEQDYLLINDVVLEGMLCMSISGANTYIAGTYYWQMFSAVGLLLIAYMMVAGWRVSKGKRFLGQTVVDDCIKYQFLLKTLVARDFKTKYKRSALGIVWSFLNPLLTMSVLYLVFSTLFKSDVQNYPVYLLSGLVCWNFFAETTNMCLTAITGNAALITKVYVPKIIYPFSRGCSSLINFGLALVPLFGVMIATRTPITIQSTLLLFGVFCLFLFALGMGMLLSAAMVFFRDTQFLWGVVSMLWMYLTPIFYTETIIPEQWLTLYKMNPLYHIVRIFRIVLIEARSPEPKAYVFCFVAAMVPFWLGCLVFKKTQDKFVLHI